MSHIWLNFYGDTFEFPFNASTFVNFTDPLSQESVYSFYQKAATNYEPIIQSLIFYKEKHKPDDWLFYQLIRKTAQQISPKAENYQRYTLYKWFFLTRCGYDATVSIAGDSLLFYVQCDENIYNIPYHIRNGKQYVCLNYHDYGGNIDFEKQRFTEIVMSIPEAQRAFSYKVTQLPDFTSSDYQEKEFNFTYYQNEYHFKIKLNPQVKNIFANYPVVDYESYFNIPLSRGTYQSLIPLLKKNLKGMSRKNGVDFLMRFTRYAFLYETDSKNFGGEKRLTPEQTLLYEQSDCEDRAALFFCLVKEIYNLPMLVLVFPEHVTIAIKFDKHTRNAIVYNGNSYYICEPTPQKQDLRIGQISRNLKKVPYEIAYVYNP